MAAIAVGCLPVGESPTSDTTDAIITSGGLSSGLNNVIRSVFYELTQNYGAKKMLGIRNGYLGPTPSLHLEPITLTEDYTEAIDKLGGTALGSFRGSQDPAVMAELLAAVHIDKRRTKMKETT